MNMYLLFDTLIMVGLFCKLYASFLWTRFVIDI